MIINLPAPPSTNRIWVQTKNRRTGVRGAARSPEYKRWIEDAKRVLLLSVAVKTAIRRKAYHGRYQLSIAVGPDPRRDLGNYEKPISDLLQKLEIVRNDKDAVRICSYWSDNVPKGWVEIMVTI